MNGTHWEFTKLENYTFSLKKLLSSLNKSLGYSMTNIEFKTNESKYLSQNEKTKAQTEKNQV